MDDYVHATFKKAAGTNFRSSQYYSLLKIVLHMNQRENWREDDHHETNSEKAFQEGTFNHETVLSENSDPKNPSNDDDRITNTEEQNVIDEDVEEKSSTQNSDQKTDAESLRDDGQPEINTPVRDPGKTEDKIPKM